MKKVRRKRIDWLKVLHEQRNIAMESYFFDLICRCHPTLFRRGTHISSNRAAYCTLKHFYSTTTIDELVRKLGL